MAARKNNRFAPTFEALEVREVASASPVFQPNALLDPASVRDFQAGDLVAHDASAQPLAAAPTAAATTAATYPDPLTSSHRTYVGLRDLRKGDILLNTTDAVLSNAIKRVTNSNYNHAAIYVGGGVVVEAVGDGVRKIGLQKYLGDNDIVRVMVLRNANLTTGQQDAVASFAEGKVGARYNVGGLAGAAVSFKPSNWMNYDRPDYFCSQLVAAAYSSAKAPLGLSLEQTPGNLAAMVDRFNLPANFSPRLTALGAMYDKGYHRSVLEGRDCVNLDVTDREQGRVQQLFAKQFNPGDWGVRLHRLTVDSDGQVRGHLTLTHRASGESWEIFTAPGKLCRMQHANERRRHENADKVTNCLRELCQGLSSSRPQLVAGHGRHAATDAAFAADANFCQPVWVG